MERILASGPEIAIPEGTMAAPTYGQACLNGSPAAAKRFVQSAPGQPWRENAAPILLPVAYYLVVVGVLAAAGYPAWRLAIVALPAVRQVNVHLFFARKRGRRGCAGDARQCVNLGADRIAWFVVLFNSTLLLTTALGAAVTGGIRSPLLVTLTAAYFAAVLVVGDRRQTRLLFVATAVAIGALALLPRGWTGPEVAGPVQGLLTAASVLGVGALLAPVHAMARKKRDELARARDEMASEALTRAESLEQVGSKVAHELKNPLTAVKALVQLGLRNPAEAPSHERLEVVEKEVSRVQAILQNYLSFSRPLQEVRPRLVELRPLVSDTLEVLSARADSASVRLYAEGDATLEADPRRLKEALLNLVANAIEATPPGGEVAVEVRPSGDGAEIVVRDTGRGIPAETLRRIGTPFFTTREDGTGLGVVLARSVIAQHGGSLRYESEPGKGTRVSVTLPRSSTGTIHASGAAGR